MARSTDGSPQLIAALAGRSAPQDPFASSPAVRKTHSPSISDQLVSALKQDPFAPAPAVRKTHSSGISDQLVSVLTQSCLAGHSGCSPARPPCHRHSGQGSAQQVEKVQPKLQTCTHLSSCMASSELSVQ